MMLLRATLMLVLALGCQASLAAEPAPEAESTATATTDSEARDSAGDGADGADEEPGEAAGSLDGEGFVPSVQISEDLSVSFPTDI